MLYPSTSGTVDTMPQKLNILIITLTASLLATPAFATLYRWVDADGTVHYTGKLPPSQASRARTELNERGIQVRKIDRAKTQEELAQERELERLRTERNKIIEKQKAKDRVLLRTFRSKDDIIMAQDGKLATIDVIIQVTISNIKRAKAQLVDLQNSAAGLERQGNKPSKKLLGEIASGRQHLKNSYATIIRREKDKEKIRQKTQLDLKRFLDLKKLKSDQMPDKMQKSIASQLDYVVPCPNTETCDSYWKKAVDYALKHATTKLKIMGDSVILTAPPNGNTDISITLSRILRKKAKGEHLFFDLQCKPSILGQKFCGSSKIAAIRSGFRKLLLGDEHRRN